MGYKQKLDIDNVKEQEMKYPKHRTGEQNEERKLNIQLKKSLT